jgi:hypothetical protein
MIVRHRKAVDEDVRGSRSRQIKAIFLEQGGERFRFPHNHLAGARAMARHMYEGGNMQDTIGEYIVESVSNMIKLNEFVRYARTNKLMNEASEDVVKTVKENINTLRNELKGLTGAKSYAKVSEAIAAREATVLEEDDTTDLQDMFTVRKFDEKIGDTLPLVRKLMNEKQAWRDALVEASQQTIYMHAKEELSEVDILEFNSPIQQVGYKIGKIAKRMVESGDLSEFVSKVAGKLIEGESISEFEKTIVRNVMENAKIEEVIEDDYCDECGEDMWGDCKCKKKDTVESISEQFELKMKMLEHEDIFTETLNEECDNCKEWDPDDQKVCPECMADNVVQESEGDTCIRCRKGTMEVGDTMMGAQEKCNRCGYQHAVREESEYEYETCLDCGVKGGHEEDCPDLDDMYKGKGRYKGLGEDYRDDPNRPGWKDEEGNWTSYESETCQTCNGWEEVSGEEGGPNVNCPDCTWMDPAGGIHSKDEEDPAKMYESDAEKAASGKVDPEDFMDDCPDCGGTGKAKDSIFDDAECKKCGGEGYV